MWDESPMSCVLGGTYTLHGFHPQALERCKRGAPKIASSRSLLSDLLRKASAQQKGVHDGSPDVTPNITQLHEGSDGSEEEELSAGGGPHHSRPITIHHNR
jgi:hypothetical protein